MNELTTKNLSEMGRSLVHSFCVLLKTARNYREGHPAMEPPVTTMLNVIRRIQNMNEEASIHLQSGYLYMGDERLKPDPITLEIFDFTIQELTKNSIGTMTFRQGLGEDELDHLAQVFAQTTRLSSSSDFKLFQKMLHQRQTPGIEIKILTQEERPEEEENRDRKIEAKAVYAQTIGAISEVMENVKMGRNLNLRKAKRVVQRLIDNLLAAETNLMGLTNIRCHDEYTYNHSVNVCILALSMGQRVGLSKPRLQEMGLAALFHDIGKSCIPLTILNKPGEFTPEEWSVMQRHPVLGVKEILRLKGADALSARILTGAFEHHMNFDFSGYPKMPYKKKISLVGSIVSISDCYDAVSSSRVYSRTAYPPDVTLKFMLKRSGTYYDPVLMKLFVNSIGVFPIGTLLLLSSRELAVVIQANPDPEKWNAPKIRIITDPMGNQVEGVVIDLSDPQSGRTAIKTLDAQKYGIDVSRYFL